MAGEVIDRGFVGACSGAEPGVRGRAEAGDLGYARDEEPLVQPGEEEGVADTAGVIWYRCVYGMRSMRP